jgi:ATP-dependent protease ClpP protease subunit
MAKHKINIRGRIIPNDYKWFYDYFEEDSTCPRDVQRVLDVVVPGDEIDVYINSPGGVIDVGSEVYTLLRKASETCNVTNYITGEACSAASIIACSGRCIMSPTALMMVHCVSSGICGNHSDMEHMAEVLRTADKALCTAYMAKAGMTEEEALEMMEHETWLTAQQAKERGLVDEVMFEEEEALPMTASQGLFKLPTEEQMNRARAMMGEQPVYDSGEVEACGYEDAIRRTREINQLRMSVGQNLIR